MSQNKQTTLTSILRVLMFLKIQYIIYMFKGYNYMYYIRRLINITYYYIIILLHQFFRNCFELIITLQFPPNIVTIQYSPLQCTVVFPLPKHTIIDLITN